MQHIWQCRYCQQCWPSTRHDSCAVQGIVGEADQQHLRCTVCVCVQVQAKMDGLGNYNQVSTEYRNLQSAMNQLQREQVGPICCFLTSVLTFRGWGKLSSDSLQPASLASQLSRKGFTGDAFACLQDMKRGALESIRDTVERASRSLSGAQYTDIDAKYGTQQIEMRTTEMAASDLEKYHKVGRICVLSSPSRHLHSCPDLE